ncbi:RNase P modulator RnpM [Ignavigranum ruoffiae]|uniref:RNase P modulator RnpM n=1 Tax=Ignavigranum ruoffiae TaxID=89093 RepID=UPI0024AD565C|nr:YlxR family protein [Ignavigranum ruoffiae]
MAKQGQKTKKIPMRRCVVSQEIFPKKELVRIVKNKEGEIFIDPTGKQNGRGAYVGLEPKLVEKAKKQKSFDKVFGVSISEAFYDELYEYVDRQKARKELFNES